MSLSFQLQSLRNIQFYLLYTEPLPQDSRLRRLPNAILTPHIAWTTKEALQRLMDITTRNLRTWLEGSGEHIVNG